MGDMPDKTPPEPTKYEDFGAQLTMLRLLYADTIAQFAEAAALDPSGYGLWESGEVLPGDANFAKLCDYFRTHAPVKKRTPTNLDLTHDLAELEACHRASSGKRAELISAGRAKAAEARRR